MTRILVCGLPGSGKTTWCQWMVHEAEYAGCTAVHLNADVVRQAFQDWRFCEQGRIAQAIRMRQMSEECRARGADIVYIDMVAPTPELRRIVNPTSIYFMDTIKEGRYEDTNKLFVPPTAEEVSHPSRFKRITEWCEEHCLTDGGDS